LASVFVLGLLVTSEAAGTERIGVLHLTAKQVPVPTTGAWRPTILVEATIKNISSKPVALLLDDYLGDSIDVRLYDPAGREIARRDNRATHGARAHPVTLKTEQLAPGQTFMLTAFDFVSAGGGGAAHEFSWELEELRGKSISIQFSYSVSPELAAAVKTEFHQEIQSGRWTSPRVTIHLPSRRD
jgi:hypothetical protein